MPDQPIPMPDDAAAAAVDFVPHLALRLGAVSVLCTVLLVFFGNEGKYGVALGVALLVCGLGTTLGVCGIGLALRDGRRLGVAIAGTLLSASLPAYLLAGMPWN
ncbi:MAG: hypothetical protein GY711_10820 [bacterium]|nr:hypothetical protein [bacterium]